MSLCNHNRAAKLRLRRLNIVLSLVRDDYQICRSSKTRYRVSIVSTNTVHVQKVAADKK